MNYSQCIKLIDFIFISDFSVIFLFKCLENQYEKAQIQICFLFFNKSKSLKNQKCYN